MSDSPAAGLVLPTMIEAEPDRFEPQALCRTTTAGATTWENVDVRDGEEPDTNW